MLSKKTITKNNKKQQQQKLKKLKKKTNRQKNPKQASFVNLLYNLFKIIGIESFI